MFWSPSHFTTLLLDSSNRTCELFEWGGGLMLNEGGRVFARCKGHRIDLPRALCLAVLALCCGTW